MTPAELTRIFADAFGASPAGTRRVLASVAVDGEGVERAGGPGTPPTAFRAWRAGSNPTDHGEHFFTARSAALLMAEQAARGNRFAFDVDHLSLSPDAPPASRMAAGWFSVEAREDAAGNPECWFVACEWVPFAAAALTSDPPGVRYFSPAYDVDAKTGEIVRLLNASLTINPATWNVTALASSSGATASTHKTEGSQMKFAAMLAALLGTDEEKKKEAIAAMQAMADAEGKEGDEPKEDPKKEAEPPIPPKKEEPKGEPDGDEPKAAAVTASLALELQKVSAKLAAFEAEKLAGERVAVLASRPDLAPSLVAVLNERDSKGAFKMSLELVKSTIKAIPVAVVDRAAAARVNATRGEGNVDGDTVHVRAARLPAEENESLKSAMGTSTKKAAVHWERNNRVYPVIDAAGAREILATRSPKGAPRQEGSSK